MGGAEGEVDGVDPFLLELRHCSRQIASQILHQVVKTEFVDLVDLIYQKEFFFFFAKYILDLFLSK